MDQDEQCRQARPLLDRDYLRPLSPSDQGNSIRTTLLRNGISPSRGVIRRLRLELSSVDDTHQSTTPQSLSILPQQQQSTWAGRAGISIYINEYCGANITGNSSCDVNINAYCNVNLNGNSTCNINVNSQCNINFNGNSSCGININSPCNASMNGNVNCHVSNHCNIRMNGNIKMNGNINCSIRDNAHALTSARNTATARVQPTRAVLSKPAPMDKTVMAQRAPNIVKTEKDSTITTAPPAKRRKLDQPIAERHGTVGDLRKTPKQPVPALDKIKLEAASPPESNGAMVSKGPAHLRYLEGHGGDEEDYNKTEPTEPCQASTGKMIKQEQDGSQRPRTGPAERTIKQEQGFSERSASVGEKRIKQEEAY